MSVIDTDRTSAYGRLVSAYDVESAQVATIKRWITDYLAEIERHHGLEVGAIPRPRSYVVSSDTEKMPEDQLPSIIVQSPGLADQPEAHGDGGYWAPWTVNWSVHLAARGNRNALRVARLYAAALRGIAVQQQRDPATNQLDMRRVDWVDERYDLLDSIDDRTICVATVELRVEVADVTSRFGGPREPTPAPVHPIGGETFPPDDSPLWPQATTFDLDIQKEIIRPYVPRPTPPTPTPEPPDPPDTGWGTLLGAWTWRPQNESDTMGAGEIRHNWPAIEDTDLLWITNQSIEGNDLTAALMALAVGTSVRVSYPGNEDLPREFVVDFVTTGPPFQDDIAPISTVALQVAFIGTTGDPTHYGEDHVLRVLAPA